MNTVKVNKVSSGKYNLDVNGLLFFLENCGCARVENWVLWNPNNLELMRFDTKRYAVNALKNWSVDWVYKLNTKTYQGY